MFLPWLLGIWRQLPLPVRQVYLRLRYGRFAIGVAALIQDEHGRVLLVRRTYSREEPWSLPGGWLEDKEPIERALERELQEETGFRVQVGRIKAAERAGFALILLMETRLVDAAAEFRASPEIAEVAWVQPSEAYQLSPVIARLLRRGLA